METLKIILIVIEVILSFIAGILVLKYSSTIFTDALSTNDKEKYHKLMIEYYWTGIVGIALMTLDLGIIIVAVL